MMQFKVSSYGLFSPVPQFSVMQLLGGCTQTKGFKTGMEYGNHKERATAANYR
jgi:hypothetical protein